MGVPLTDGIVVAEVVPLTDKESGHQPSRNAHRSQHHNHGRGVVLTIARLAQEEKIFDRTDWNRRADIQAITIIRSEVLFDGHSHLMGGLGLPDDVPGQLRDLRTHGRKLKEMLPNGVWIVERGRQPLLFQQMVGYGVRKVLKSR